MNLENTKVKHKAFGDGVIVSIDGKYITVRFANVDKVFVYPDIFERFLTLEDGSVSDEILADIKGAKEVKEKIQTKKQEENYLAMTKGIVIPGKEIVPEENEDEENREKTEIEEI